MGSASFSQHVDSDNDALCATSRARDDSSLGLTVGSDGSSQHMICQHALEYFLRLIVRSVPLKLRKTHCFVQLSASLGHDAKTIAGWLMGVQEDVAIREADGK